MGYGEQREAQESRLGADLLGAQQAALEDVPPPALALVELVVVDGQHLPWDPNRAALVQPHTHNTTHADTRRHTHARTYTHAHKTLAHMHTCRHTQTHR